MILGNPWKNYQRNTTIILGSANSFSVRPENRFQRYCFIVIWSIFQATWLLIFFSRSFWYVPACGREDIHLLSLAEVLHRRWPQMLFGLWCQRHLFIPFRHSNNTNLWSSSWKPAFPQCFPYFYDWPIIKSSSLNLVFEMSISNPVWDLSPFDSDFHLQSNPEGRIPDLYLSYFFLEVFGCWFYKIDGIWSSSSASIQKGKKSKSNSGNFAYPFPRDLDLEFSLFCTHLISS